MGLEVSGLGPEAPSGARNAALQSLRGLAATAVLLYHAAFYTAQQSGTHWLGGLISERMSFYGVLTFFVLSGFLMQAAVQRYDAATFLLHRFARLFPTYWLMCLAFHLVQSWRMQEWQPIPWAALTLLPMGEFPRPLGVEWTLLYEVFFYVVCAALCTIRRLHLPILLVWLAVVAIAVFRYDGYGSVVQPTWTQIPFSIWNVGFICGSLAGFCSRFIARVNSGTAWIVAFTLILLGEFPEAGGLLLSSAGIAIIVVICARSRSDLSARNRGILFMLGEYSYGIYLAHSLSIQIALQYVPASRLSQPVAIFAAMVGVGLGIGVLAGCIDVALYKRLKRLIDDRHGAREASPARLTS